MQMTSTETADPALFPADLGKGRGKEGTRAVARRAALTSFQAPRFRQGQLHLRGEEEEQEEEGRGGGEGGEEGNAEGTGRRNQERVGEP
jgi:hypothetical protein